MSNILNNCHLCLAFHLCVGMFFIVLGCYMPFSIAELESEDVVEFRINGESVTKESIEKGLVEASQCSPEVCPTDKAQGWKIRRERLIRLIPIRQFLDKENIKINDAVIEKQIEDMKQQPNPLGRHPPRRLEQVMVRECISWDDLRLMIRVEQGMTQWTEQQWQKKWGDKSQWEKYCTNHKADFEAKYGKFRIYNFSIFDWPAGAKTEEEAIEKLKLKAFNVKENLDNGKAVEEHGTISIIPYAFWEESHAENLKKLQIDGPAEVLRMRFGWMVVKREKITQSEISDVLKKDFIQQIRAEAEERIAKETKLEKVAWTEFHADISAE